MKATAELTRYRLHVGGESVDAAAGATFDSLNPTTGQVWAQLALAGAEDVDRAVRAAQRAFEGEAWRGLSPTKRGRLMMRLGDLIAERAEEIAAVEVADNGKLYKEMVGQLRVIPDWLYYYGGLADKVEGRVIPLDRTSVFNYTLREPLGVVGIIIPLELACPPDDVLAGAGAGGGERGDREAVGACVRERARDAEPRRGGGLPRRE